MFRHWSAITRQLFWTNANLSVTMCRINRANEKLRAGSGTRTGRCWRCHPRRQIVRVPDTRRKAEWKYCCLLTRSASQVSVCKNSIAKEVTLWRSTQTSSRHSLLPKCHTVSRYTRVNVISLDADNSTAFAASIFTTLTNDQQRCVQICCTEFHVNRTINVGKMDTVTCAPQ
jgi:hypothetical protein